MPVYQRLGTIPPKRHTKLERPKNESFLEEGLYYEHVVTTEGFDRAYSIVYHLRPPTRVLSTKLSGRVPIEQAKDLPLRHHHLKTAQMQRHGDPITGRLPLLFNDDLVCYRSRPEYGQKSLYRNGAADEVVFIHSGSGIMRSTFGQIEYRRGDYLVIPRMTTYELVSNQIESEDHLILECFSPVRLPHRYLNQDGQIKLGAPFSERDFRGPKNLETIDEEGSFAVDIKDHERLTRVELASHPFDAVGWDGYSYPYAFNAWDFEPLTGTVHLPPPYQQTFECNGFVICTFAPRHLDHHPEAIKVPYVHSNVEADEVLFYVDGQFGSRKGVESASLTLHPGGIPHGPHPGTIMKSMDMDFTDEMAVMFDTLKPLKLTKQAVEFDDPSYPSSWLEES